MSLLFFWGGGGKSQPPNQLLTARVFSPAMGWFGFWTSPQPRTMLVSSSGVVFLNLRTWRGSSIYWAPRSPACRPFASAAPWGRRVCEVGGVEGTAPATRKFAGSNGTQQSGAFLICGRQQSGPFFNICVWRPCTTSRRGSSLQRAAFEHIRLGGYNLPWWFPAIQFLSCFL